jgi:lipopolysaccharide transport system ATP-binding protein
MKPAIRVENLSKQYRIGTRKRAASLNLTESIIGGASGLWRGLTGRRPGGDRADSFWALKDVSFEVQPGEVVGVIGRNGAGKSTLLKVLSRIVEPTSGRAVVRGRLASLLEVGTGFHTELTGRENVYLNGAILGMTKGEVQRKFEEIVEFSGIGPLIDTPVKRYSSGMYARLAFAVAAHLEPDILVVDEVLAVGDLAFQKKCLSRMREESMAGRTVIFVTHNMTSVAQLCTKGLLLQGGQMVSFGNVRGVIAEHLNMLKSAPASNTPTRRSGTGEYRFVSVHPVAPVFEASEEKVFRFRVERIAAQPRRIFLSAHVVNEEGAVVAHCDSRLIGHWSGEHKTIEGEFRLRSPWLKPGEYHLDLYVCGPAILDHFENASRFEVSPVLPYPHDASSDGTHLGPVLAEFDWVSWPQSGPSR